MGAQRRGAGVGAVFLGLSVCQSGLGRCRGVALAGKGRVVEGTWPGPPSPAWGSPTCPPTGLACLGSQACSGLRPLVRGHQDSPQTPAGPSSLAQPFHQELLRVGVGLQSPGHL